MFQTVRTMKSARSWNLLLLTKESVARRQMFQTIRAIMRTAVLWFSLPPSLQPTFPLLCHSKIKIENNNKTRSALPFLISK
jgi:hypothetical protein